MPARQPIRKKSSRVRRAGNGAENRLRVLFIEESTGWSAQVLEHDIATQADTLQDLFYEVERMLVAHIAFASSEGRPPFEGIPPAPKKYWEMFEKSKISMRRPMSGLKVDQSRPPNIKQDIRIAERIAA